MWSFLKTFFATLLALFVFGILSIFILIGIVTALSSKETVSIKENSVLKLTLDKPILEREFDNPLSDLNLPISSESKIGLLEIKKAIKSAKSDSKIKGIYLNISSIQAGMATVEEIRKCLSEFKESGKFIYAYSEFYSEGGYYLSSIADSVFVNPSGLMEFNGLKSEIMFFKGTLEKLDLKPEIFKVGSYKSAVEPLMFDKMSDASREQTTSFLFSIQNTIYKNIAASRKIAFTKLTAISDSMFIRKPIDAVRFGLADNVLYYDEVEVRIKKKLGIDKKDKIDFVSYRKYTSAIKNQSEKEEDKKESKGKVAVIIAQGDIESGRADEETIGSDKISEELRAAREDEDVKAIVLRINSPGGSSMASDIMWREVQLAAKEKPVIASMGDVAASGGYYIAMAADTIVAQANTITGSIGVFGILLDAQGFFKNKLGITFDRVKTGKFSDIGTTSRPLNEYERKVIQKEVNDIYTDFVQKAAEGRNMNYQDVDKVASGRVWTGEQAKENGLVDVLGDFDKAIELAAKAAHLGENYEIVYLPKQKDFFERLMHDIETSVSAIFQQSSATFVLERTYQDVVKKYNGIQARLPFDFKIQ
jgi:protease IV